MTGYTERVNRTAEHPCFGSVVSKLRSETNGAVPPFVSLRGMSRGTEPGYLGIAHRPFTPSGPGIANLRLANGVSPRPPRRSPQPPRPLRRHPPRHRRLRHHEGNGRLHREGHRHGRPRASSATRSTSRRRTQKTQDRYKGVEQFLTARRLVEAGVGCVTLSIGGWDTHGQNFQTLKRQLPQVDRGHRQPDPGPARSRHGRRRGDGDVGRVRPHAEDQRQRRPRPLGAGDVRADRRRRPQDGPGRRREHRQGRTAEGPPATRCRKCSAPSTGNSASTRP